MPKFFKDLIHRLHDLGIYGQCTGYVSLYSVNQTSSKGKLKEVEKIFGNLRGKEEGG